MYYKATPNTALIYHGNLTLEITAVIYHCNLPWYFYNIGPLANLPHYWPFGL